MRAHGYGGTGTSAALVLRQAQDEGDWNMRKKPHAELVEARAFSSTVVIEGYASRWWARDLNDDVVAAGAFRASLERSGPGGVKMLHGHEGRSPVGVWDEVREDTAGLFVRGRVLDWTPEGRMAAALVRAGAVDGLSIGFRAVRSRADETGRLRVLTEVELWEVSLVTFPMLPSARISGVRTTRAAA